MESEMVYRFDGKDAIDISFSAVPGNEQFSQGYVGFMWATYQSRFLKPGIYIKCLPGQEDGWECFAPVSKATQCGGTVASHDAKVITAEPGYSELNIPASKELYFTMPCYYGLLDVSVAESDHQNPMAYIMMFDQSTPIRFSVWNWCNPVSISAWDWQFILDNPQPYQKAGYRARMICQEFDSTYQVSSIYKEWNNSAATAESEGNSAIAFPDLSLYWSPYMDTFEPMGMAACIVEHNSWRALELYVDLLSFKHYAPRAAKKLVALLPAMIGEQDMGKWLDSHISSNRSSYALWYLGIEYYNSGIYTLAAALLETAYKNDPGNLDICLYLGASYLWLDRINEGVELISLVRKKDAYKNAEAAKIYAAKGDNACISGELALAEKMFREAMQAAPDDLLFTLKFAEVSERLGNYESALTAYQLVITQVKEAFSASASMDSLLLQHYGSDRCAETWQQIHKDRPDLPLPMIYLGKSCEAAGNHDAAGVLYERALRQMPALMFAAEKLDRFLLQHRDAETRLQEWAVLHGNYPDSGVVCLFYGMSLRGAGRMDEALASFGELAGSHVGFKDDAQLQIAVTEVMRNKDAAGVNKIAAWADLHPQRKSEAASLCSEAGRYFMGLKEYENAVLLFGMACEWSPDDMWPCVAKGEALTAAGKHEQAIQVYKDVLSKAPESPYTAFNLDTLFIETNERITFWRELHEMHPEAAIPLMYLGKAQEAAGEHTDALLAYQEALEIDPSLDDARNGIVRLQAAAAAEGE